MLRPIDQLRAAIENEGPMPEVHRRVMRRRRLEWPVLWRAIDALMDDHDDKHVERFGSQFPR